MQDTTVNNQILDSECYWCAYPKDQCQCNKPPYSCNLEMICQECFRELDNGGDCKCLCHTFI